MVEKISTDLTSNKLDGVNLQHQVLPSTLREMHIVTVENGKDGMLIAKCSELDVITQGKTIKEVQYNAIEAIELMRSELDKADEFSVNFTRKI